jgi:hypothetical protein
VHPILLTNRILWASILFASLISPVVLVVIDRGATEFSQFREPVALPALAALALTTAIMSRVLPPFMRRQAFARQQLRVEHQADPDSALALYRGAAPTRRVFADREGARKVALHVQLTTSTLGLALSEAVGMFGLVLGIMGFELWQAAAFFAVSTLLIVTLFPMERRAIHALEKHFDARLV